MDIALVPVNSNSNSSTNNSIARIPSDIENNINDNGIDDNIDDNNSRTVIELVNEDRSLMMFLMILGLYIDDERNSLRMKILGRLWQSSLLLFGGIGFIWSIFFYGFYWISDLHETLSSSSTTNTDKFIGFGMVLSIFIVPVVQVITLMYGIHNVFNKILGQTVNVTLIAKCKRTAVFYFTFMALLIVIIYPFTMTRSVYKEDFDDGYLNRVKSRPYPLFVFEQFTTNLSYNLCVLCYLTVVMFFTSVSLKEIMMLQKKMIKMIEYNTLETIKYMHTKDKITSLKDGTYLLLQILTITAAINIITGMFLLWFNNYNYTTQIFNYEELILYQFYLFPYLLKEVVFFFYALYLAASINTLHDDFYDIANKNFWVVKKKIETNESPDTREFDNQLLWSYTMIRTENYSLFKLLEKIEVRRNEFIFSIVFFIGSCLKMLLDFKGRV